MKRYEGLFILNITGKEEGIKDIIDAVTADINAAGAKVETVQKMDKRPFSRVADPRRERRRVPRHVQRSAGSIRGGREIIIRGRHGQLQQSYSCREPDA